MKLLVILVTTRPRTCYVIRVENVVATSTANTSPALRNKKGTTFQWFPKEVPAGIEPAIEVLQTFALPLGYGTI